MWSEKFQRYFFSEIVPYICQKICDKAIIFSLKKKSMTKCKGLISRLRVRWNPVTCTWVLIYRE